LGWVGCRCPRYVSLFSHAHVYITPPSAIRPSLYPCTSVTGMPPPIQRAVQGVVGGHTLGLIRNTLSLRIVQRVKCLVLPGAELPSSVLRPWLD